MHHKNHRHSSENHNLPHHEKSEYQSHPAPQSDRKHGFLGGIREKFREKPTTREEVEELGLRAKKETYKTQIANAKKARPSALGGLLFGGPAPTRPYPRGRSSRPSGYQDTSGGWLMGSSGGSGWSNAEFGSGLDNMLGAGSSGRQLRGRQKKVKSGFDEMFGVG